MPAKVTRPAKVTKPAAVTKPKAPEKYVNAPSKYSVQIDNKMNLVISFVALLLEALQTLALAC